jgi:hypothetical protein
MFCVLFSECLQQCRFLCQNDGWCILLMRCLFRFSDMPGIWQDTELLDSGILVGVTLSIIIQLCAVCIQLHSLQYCPQLLSQLVSVS